MVIRAILIDIDGTMLDSNDAHTRSWMEVLARHGLDRPYDQVRPLMGMGGDKMLARLAGLDPSTTRAKESPGSTTS